MKVVSLNIGDRVVIQHDALTSERFWGVMGRIVRVYDSQHCSCYKVAIKLNMRETIHQFLVFAELKKLP